MRINDTSMDLLLAGENEVTINGEDRQRFSSMHKLWHVELLEGEMPVLESQPIDDAVMVCHWRRRYMPQTHPDATLSLTHNDNQHIMSQNRQGGFFYAPISLFLARNTQSLDPGTKRGRVNFVGSAMATKDKRRWMNAILLA
jgi:hypothetical protein